MKTFSLACLLLLLTGAALAATDSTLKSGVFNPPRMAPDFTLPASNGEDFTLSEHRGKVVVLGFGFSHCPQICPMTLITLTEVKDELGSLADQVQVVFMTVDPERDSAEQLRTYLSHFNSDFIGLTGDPEKLTEVRRVYGITTKKEVYGEDHYEVHHSSYLYLVDREGLLRTLVPFGAGAEDIAHDIRILLREGSTPDA